MTEDNNKAPKLVDLYAGNGEHIGQIPEDHFVELKEAKAPVYNHTTPQGPAAPKCK